MAENLSDVMAQLRRTSELINAVDLDKIKAHDPAERSKLGNVEQALERIEAGEVIDHVEGVDEVQVDTDPEQARRSHIMLLVDDAGFGERIGRVTMVEGGVKQLRPIDLVPHTQGLPDHDLCLAAEHGKVDGAHGVFISAVGVFAASIGSPFTRHHWRILQSTPFDSDAELVKTLQRFLKPAH